jgi:hypothetical protein
MSCAELNRFVGVVPEAKLDILRNAQLLEPTRAKPRRPINIHA